MAKIRKMSSLIKEADKWFSIFIRKRDNGVCYTCGNKRDWKEQNCGHYVLRQYYDTRWNEQNCHCQCVY